MKLSIVILCWNDRKVIADCLQSIFERQSTEELEVIVSDNGSTDGSVEFVREHYPRVRVIENGTNLRFAKGNNIGIRESSGHYVLILNPDTLIHGDALEQMVVCAERHPEAGAIGCRVLNADGSYQGSARPFPTVWRDCIAALYLRSLAYLSDAFISDRYVRWSGDSERTIDWQSGCCLMVRAELLKQLGGFDEQFYYYFEDVDLCHRVWDAGYSVVYTPNATITHLSGQSIKSFHLAFELDKFRNRYRYFYKYFGSEGVRRSRLTVLAWLYLRIVGYSCLQLAKRSPGREQRIAMYRLLADWNRQLDPAALVLRGEEPQMTLHEPVHLPTVDHPSMQAEGGE